MRTAEQEAVWQAWLAERPPQVRAVVELIQPGIPYRLKETGQKMYVYCYDEHPDGTVTLKMTALHKDNPESINALCFPWTDGITVFGIKPEDLEPWT
jgi:hypothetical protein